MAAYRKYSANQLLQMLTDTLHKETELWVSLRFKDSDEVDAKARDAIVWQMSRFHNKLGFAPETLCMAVSVLDRFLNTVKAKTKHLQVIGAACSLLAAKTLEEEETIPETLEIVRASGCGCSVAEVVRMERLILDKLSWDLRTVTALDFLHILLSLVAAHDPDLVGGSHRCASTLNSLTGRLLVSLCCHQLLDYRPSVLAVSLLSLELEKSVPDWFNLVQALQSRVQASDTDLMKCREELLYLHQLALSAPRPVPARLPPHTSQPARPAFTPELHRSHYAVKRKSHDEEDDDVFEAIKRLYNDEEIIPRRQSSRGRRAGGVCRPKLRESHSVPAAMQTVAN